MTSPAPLLYAPPPMSPNRLALFGTLLGALAVLGVTLLAPSLAFGSAAFLGGLAAAALPLIIHLINRRRARVHPFPALAFLLASNRRVAQRLRLRQFLLLLVRTLLIACVPLALSKPAYESDPGELATGPGPSANVIVVDNSFSMSYRLGRRSLFDTARRRALSLLDDLPREATAAVLLGVAPFEKHDAREPVATVGAAKAADVPGATGEHAELTFDHHEVREAVARAQVAASTADLEAAIRRADTLLALSPLPQKRIVVFTDLARHSWPTRASAAQPLPLTSGAQLVVQDVSDGAALPNHAVVSVEVVPAADLGPGGHRVTARIANFSERPETSLPVELKVGQSVVTRGFVDVPAGGVSEKVFHHRFPEGGVVEGELSIVPDALADDDRRRFALDVRRPARALVINGDPRQVPHLDEVFYLERALRLSGSPVELRISPVDERPVVPLTGFDVVFLANVRELGASRSAELRRFVENGGGLFLSVGSEVEVDHYNLMLGDLLPRRLRAARDATYGGGAPVRFARPVLEHPVLAVFTGSALDGLVSGEVRRYLHVEPGDDADVLLRYDDGAAALLQARRGRGRVLLLTTTIDRDWTDLPIRTAFLPLVQQSARYLASTIEGPGTHDVVVGDVRQIPIPGSDADEVLVEGPKNLRIRLAGDSVRGRQQVAFEDTRALGIYRVSVTRKGRVEPGGAFAVNPPPIESDLAKLAPSQVASLVPKRAPSAAQSAFAATLGQTALWPWIAFALLAFLLAEGFMVRKV